MSTTTQALENGARREIAKQFVGLYKEYVGRGPTSARTYVDGDLVLVLLADSLTQGERKLAEEARLQLVRELRRSFRGAMHDQVVEVVREQTGRRVLAALSDHSVQPDYGIEAFVLEPIGDRPDENSQPATFANNHNGHRAISRGMISLFKEYVGRGPKRARTFIMDDLVAVVLEDTLTKAEKTLAENNRETMVREIRRHFQGAMRDDAIALIEEHLPGRTVKAFLSDNAVYPDFAIEAFLLEAAPDRA